MFSKINIIYIAFVCAFEFSFAEIPQNITNHTTTPIQVQSTISTVVTTTSTITSILLTTSINVATTPSIAVPSAPITSLTTASTTITTSTTANPTVTSLEPSSTTQLNVRILPECSLSCEKCGETSKCIVECGGELKECLYNKTECSTKCECKSGYGGKDCSEIQINVTKSIGTTNISTTTSSITTKTNEVTPQVSKTTPTILEETFERLKNKVWSEIIKDLNSLQPSEPNTNLIQNILSKLNYLTYELVQNEKLDIHDILTLSKTLQILTNQNPKKFFITEEQISNLIKVFDDILELNYKIYSNSNRSKSILEEANGLNRSGLDMFDCIDKLNRFYFSHAFSKSMQIDAKNFKMILSDSIKPSQDTFPNEISLMDKLELTDKIMLDEKILKNKYKNNSIRIAFKIHFNKNVNGYSSSDIDVKRREFYKNLERPKNFFYDMTLTESEISENEIEDNYLISSNILSARIFAENSATNTELDSNMDYSKFVRIQFLINLKKFTNFNEKSLKCVFWNATSSKWSTHGCVTSQSESCFVQNITFKKVCYCNHLTNFALFFDVNYSIASDYSILLSTLSHIGVGVSLTCYFILIISRLGCFCFNKRGIKQKGMPSHSKTLRHLYLINSACLFVVNVCFLLLTFLKPNLNLDLCKLNAICLHFFLLFSFCFSFGIAYQHFSRLVKVFNIYESMFIFKISLFAFTYAGLFTICEIVFGYNADYTFTDVCWLRKPFIYYFFIGPLSLLLIVSLVFYLFVVYKVLSIYGKNELSEIDANSYNNTRVIVLLFFSFISLNLTWLVGIFITLASLIDQSLKFYLEVLFTLFNSFHGLSLLIGQYLAHKYSKSGSYSNNSFTKTVLTQSSQNTKTSGVTSSSSDYVSSLGEDSNSKKRSSQKSRSTNKRLRPAFFSRLVYYFTAFNKCCINKRKKNDTNNKFRPKKSNVKGSSFKRSPFLEFTLVNYEMDSDSNNPNFQTFQTNLPNFEINLINSNNNAKKEILSSYFDTNRQDKVLLNNEDVSLTCDIRQDAFTSSV